MRAPRSQRVQVACRRTIHCSCGSTESPPQRQPADNSGAARAGAGRECGHDRHCLALPPAPCSRMWSWSPLPRAAPCPLLPAPAERCKMGKNIGVKISCSGGAPSAYRTRSCVGGATRAPTNKQGGAMNKAVRIRLTTRGGWWRWRACEWGRDMVFGLLGGYGVRAFVPCIASREPSACQARCPMSLSCCESRARVRRTRVIDVLGGHLDHRKEDQGWRRARPHHLPARPWDPVPCPPFYNRYCSLGKGGSLLLLGSHAQHSF